LGLWLMHQRLLPGELSEWYRSVVLRPLFFCLPIVGLSWWSMPTDMNRLSIVAWLGVTSLLTIMSMLLTVRFKGVMLPKL
jgi:hypothetical protein